MNRLPEWLKKDLFGKTKKEREEREKIKKLLRNFDLHTVCEEARCPNISECFSNHTLTFMILGNICTRNCKFCNVKKGKPKEVDLNEPEKIAKMAEILNLKYVVVTSPTRDDLPDFGANQFKKVIEKIKEINLFIEVLTPDFNGDEKAINLVLDAKPDVFNHNIETVPRLYEFIRPKANYIRSLKLIEKAKNKVEIVKSGIILGLGERKEEIIQSMKDLKNAGCDILTLGQYLQPSKRNIEVQRYILKEEFEELKKIGEEIIKFRIVISGPFVRSSYKAYETYQKLKNGR